MKLRTSIVVDSKVPDGQMVGHDETDDVIVTVEYMPVFKYIHGSSADHELVKTWHVSEQYARRVGAINEWALYGWPCTGVA